MRFGLKPVMANLALLGVSVVFALGAAELALRIAPGLLPEEARLRLSWQAQRTSHVARTRADSMIGFLYLPNGSTEFRQGELHFSYTTDRDGFRNAGPRLDTAEVVALGDSWTFGFGVDDSAAWPRLLADSLRPAQVANLGLIGSGPGQYTRVYQRFGAPLQPRVVLYGIFPGNDVDDERAFDDWRRQGAPGNFAEWRINGRSGGSQPLWQRSHLLVAIQEGWKYRHQRFAGETIRLADGSPLQLAPAPLEAKAERTGPEDPAFRECLAAIGRARNLAAAAHAHLLVLVFPTKEEVYLPLRGRHAPPLVAHWLPELQRLQVPYLDLTRPFQASADGPPLYFEVDGHANARGNRLIAASVAAYLREHEGELGLADTAAR
jgi:hypothetical protein